MKYLQPIYDEMFPGDGVTVSFAVKTPPKWPITTHIVGTKDEISYLFPFPGEDKKLMWDKLTREQQEPVIEQAVRETLTTLHSAFQEFQS